MKSVRRLGIFALALVASSTALADELIGARWLSLSPDGSRLAFSYQGDIWVAPASGGKAVRITDNVEMDDRPVWSPDGSKIAFQSDRFGNFDVFVVGADGGKPKRVTWFSGNDVPYSWDADGKSITLIRTFDNGYRSVVTLDTETLGLKSLFSDQMPIDAPQASPEGDKVLYGRFGFPWQRPRYQGSAAEQLWLFDKKTGKRTEVRSNGYQHLWPNITKSGIYAVTMTDPVASSSTLTKSVGKVTFTVGGTPNVYKIDAKGSAKRLTNFAGDGARFLAASRDGSLLAFERDGSVYTLKPGGEPVKVTLTANLDDKISTEENVVLTEGAEAATLSPDGSTIVFSAGSEIWSVPVKKGEGPNRDDAVRWSEWEGVDSAPIYTPDGKGVFFTSDREGALMLYRLDLATKKAVRVSTESASVENLQLTPDRKSLAYQQYGPNGGIYTVPVEGGKPTQVVKRPGRANLEYSFSPDGKYVAFVEILEGSGLYYWDSGNNVFVQELATGKKTNVTQTNADHHAPIWTPDGKYLYFLRSGALTALPLKPEELRSNELTMKFEKPKDAVKVEIDFEDIETRSRRIGGVNGPIFTFDKEDGSFYYAAPDGVYKADYNGENPRRVTGGSNWVELSEDGRTLTVTQGGRIYNINTKAPGFPAMPISFRAEFTRDISKVRAAAYQQFWRAYNDSFYDHNFHGRDWNTIGEKYRKFLPSVGHRREMATLLGFLTGELEASHAEVSPGPGGARSTSSAVPGFVIDYSYSGPGIKVLDVPKRTPGAYAKTKLNPGDVVTKISGKEVSTNEALFRDVLNDQVGRELTMTVKGVDGKEREVKSRALSTGEYGGIIRQNKLESNRKWVESNSNGDFTYVQIAGMDGGSLDRFNQQIWQYAKGKKGVVIDVRGNGGGNTADRIIDILERRQNMNYVPRDEALVSGPGTVLNMPIVVMCDETSFSNAEMFPEAMRARKLAKIVGRPTSGYVIYTGGLPLVDGTQGRMPGTGVYRVDGTPMENMGVVPDFVIDVSPEQYLQGFDPQLAKAIEVLRKG
jgi:Tol biopolymer transport system component/C-terminal processing protease CtpA/Prc